MKNGKAAYFSIQLQEKFCIKGFEERKSDGIMLNFNCFGHFKLGAVRGVQHFFWTCGFLLGRKNVGSGPCAATYASVNG